MLTFLLPLKPSWPTCSLAEEEEDEEEEELVVEVEPRAGSKPLTSDDSYNKT